MADVLSSVRFYKRLLEKEDPKADLAAIYEIIEKAIDSNVDEFSRSVYGFILEAEELKDEKSYLKAKKLIRMLNAELNYRSTFSRSFEKWDEEKELYTLITIKWQEREITIPLPILKYYLSRLGNLQRYLEAINPDLTTSKPKGTQTPAPDEIEPPQPPKEGKGESVIIPPGTYYFQYNVMKELGLIDKIRSRFHDNNGRGVSNSEIGQILFDIFQHKSPEEWSKAHSQYGTESSNDPIKAEIQQRRLRDFLRQNNLKE